MEWCDSLPEKAGKYIVKTETNFLKKELILTAEMTISEKGDKNWSFNNQKFKYYLKE